MCGPTTHIVPMSLTRHPQDAFPAVGLCSSVFLPLHNLGGLQADSEAPRHAPTRQMADLIREDLLSRRPLPFFLLAWAVLAHHVFLTHRNIPRESTQSLAGTLEHLKPSRGRWGCHGVASRRSHQRCVCFQTPQGHPRLRQTLRHPGNYVGKQSCPLFMNVTL